ncbi:MAG: hotdog domain-containing protein [Dehalococcoidia bacterium]
MDADRTIWLPATYKIPPRLPDPDVTFTSVEVGPIPGRYRLLVRASDVVRWASLHDDDPRRYRSEDGTPIAPPSILYFASMNLLGREWKGGGFARYAAQFLGAVPIGQPIDVSAVVVDKFLRRGRGWIVWRLDAMVNGQLIQRHWKVWAFEIAPGDEVGWPGEDYQPVPFGNWVTAQSSSPPDPLPTRTLAITLGRMADFEGPGEDNVHTNPVIALERYGAAPVAQGELSFGLLCSALHDAVGNRFSLDGALDVRFLKPVHAGDVLTTRGELRSTGARSMECRVDVVNQHGEVVTTGGAVAGASDVQRAS